MKKTAQSVANSLKLESQIDIIVGAARASESLLRDAFGATAGAKISNEDIKLEEDRGSEALIVDYIRSRSDWPILTEEGGWIGPAAVRDAPYWVVDPLDGSFNFYTGVPLYAVAVALCCADRPVLGCINAIASQEVFLGGEGVPLRINGAETLPRRRAGAVLATGFPVARKEAAAPAPDARWKKIRMFGSAALSLAWVASGRVGGYRESGVRWWDVAAGLALVRSADGEIAVCASGGGAFDPAQPLDVAASLSA